MKLKSDPLTSIGKYAGWYAHTQTPAIIEKHEMRNDLTPTQLKVKIANMFRDKREATNPVVLDDMLSVYREMFLRIISGDADEYEVKKMFIGDEIEGERFSNYGNINTFIETKFKGKSNFLKEFYTGADTYDPPK